MAPRMSARASWTLRAVGLAVLIVVAYALVLTRGQVVGWLIP